MGYGYSTSWTTKNRNALPAAARKAKRSPYAKLPTERARRGPRSAFTDEQVFVALVLVDIGISCEAIGRRYGCAASVVRGWATGANRGYVRARMDALS